jgi:hypothetical protein
MIRQRVTRHGAIHALPPPTDLPGCCMSRELVGVVKVGTVRKWLEHKRRWDSRFKQAKAGVHKQRLRDLATGYEVFGAGDVPPPSALAGRRRLGYAAERKQQKKQGRAQKGKKAARSLGLSLWALWGSKHDEATVQRESLAVKTPELAAAGPGQGQGARHFSDLERQEREARSGGGAAEVPSVAETSKPGAWTGLVVAEKGKGVGDAGAGGDAASVPADQDEGLDLRPAGPVADGHENADTEGEAARPQTGGGSFLSPDDAHDTGVSGKRVIIGGLATPFSLRKEPETASMITLASPMDRSSVRLSTADSSSFMGGPWGKASDDHQAAAGSAEQDKREDGNQGGLTPGLETPFMTPFLSPAERPELDRFVTAEEVVKAGGA